MSRCLVVFIYQWKYFLYHSFSTSLNYFQWDDTDSWDFSWFPYFNSFLSKVNSFNIINIKAIISENTVKILFKIIFGLQIHYLHVCFYHFYPGSQQEISLICLTVCLLIQWGYDCDWFWNQLTFYLFFQLFSLHYFNMFLYLFIQFFISLSLVVLNCRYCKDSQLVFLFFSMIYQLIWYMFNLFASLKSKCSHMGLLSWQWNAFKWACL